MHVTKTIYQPLGHPVAGNGSANEIDVGEGHCFLPGTYVSVAHGGCCEVDRVVSSFDGLLTLTGSYSGCVEVQALADLSGCWLELVATPLPPVSLGIICATEKGVLLDRMVDACVAGRTLVVNGKSLGVIHGAAVLSGGRSILSVENPRKIEGVGIAHAGFNTATKGPRVSNSPFAGISAQLPTSGSMALYLRQGWQSAKACIPDVISYSELLCSGAL